MNPFRYGQVVSRDFYCPRSDLEAVLTEKIRSCQNILVNGERRIGKTSLVLRAVESTKNFKVLYVDLLEVKTIEDIHKRFLNAMLRYENKSQLLQNMLKKMASLRPVVTFDALSGLPSVSLDSSADYKPDSLDGLLGLLEESAFSRAVVVIDEFQDVLNCSEKRQILAIMRGRIQFLTKTPFIFSGSVRNAMEDIFNDPQSPFFKSALTVAVGPINHLDFRNFIEKRFASAGLKLSVDLLEKIFTVAGENTGDIQQFCSALFDVADKKSITTEATLNEALTYIFAQEQKGYESTLTLLTAIQLKCLSAVARLGGSGVLARAFLAATGIRQPSTVKKSLERLCDVRILFRMNGVYRFVNPYFGKWLVWRNF